MKRLTTVTVLVTALVASAVAQQAQNGSGAGQGQAQQATTVITPEPGQAQGRATTPPPGQGRGQRATTTTQSGQGRGQRAMTTVQPDQDLGFSRAQAINVRLDITINDQSVTGQPARKSISLLLADRSSGRVRSSGMVHQQIQHGLGPDGNPLIDLRPLFEVNLNVDAEVSLRPADKIYARITLEYTPGGSDPLPQKETVRPSPLNQSVSVILQNGKPLIITQAADPLSDRKITVEVTATILR